MCDSSPLSDPAYRRSLGDDLILRWSTAQDVEGIAMLYQGVFRDGPDAPLNQHVAIWTRDMMSGRHPLIGPTDFALVEHVGQGTIVAATCLLSMTWTYGGIALPMGRPEVVATLADYRNRGLIRAIFTLIHARSAARGHLVQGITGIPYFYRQFGYEYALDLDTTRSLPLSAIPPLAEGHADPFHLRAATPTDIPALLDLYNRDRAFTLTSTEIDATYWQWLLEGITPERAGKWRISMIVDETGRTRGYAIAMPWAERGGLSILALGTTADTGLTSVLPSVLRTLRDVALATPSMPGTQTTIPTTLLHWGMGRGHPIYEALGDLLPPAPRRPYCWYVRVPALPTLLQRIAPVLEERLRHSVMAGYSGEVKIDLYLSGLRLVFSTGKMTLCTDWRRQGWEKAHCGCPLTVFPQLVFGYRSLDDLRDIFPDVWAKDDAVPLLRALFPAQPSWVIPLD